MLGLTAKGRSSRLFRSFRNEVEYAVLFSHGYLQHVAADAHTIPMAQWCRHYTLIIEISSIDAAEIHKIVPVISALDCNVLTRDIVCVEGQVITCPATDGDAFLAERLSDTCRETIDDDVRLHLDQKATFDRQCLLSFQCPSRRSWGNIYEQQILSHANLILIMELALRNSLAV